MKMWSFLQAGKKYEFLSCSKLFQKLFYYFIIDIIEDNMQIQVINCKICLNFVAGY